jgi:hypothetical protein
MVGLNWPQPYLLHALCGPDEDESVAEQENLTALVRHAIVNLSGFPLEGFNVKESGAGGSDHLRFQAVGVPTTFFIGGATYYTYHTKGDLLIYMEQVAGGRDWLIKGFKTVAWVGFYTAMLLDNENTIRQVARD